MTNGPSRKTVEEKRAMLRARLSSGRKIPKTYPASYSQRRLWFMHNLVPDSAAYNVEAALPLGPIDTVTLERAVNGVVARHAALRTTFIEVDGEPVQKVTDVLHIPLEICDFTTLPSNDRDARVAQLRKDCATEPFDLTTGPLVRTKLIRLSTTKNLLLLNLHHILADGWSMGIFGRELTALFEAFAQGKPSPLLPLSVQYGDFAVWQRQAGDGDGFDAEVGFWTHKLAGMTMLDVPTDFPRPPVQSYAGAFHNTTFSKDLTTRLDRFSRDMGATLFMTLLTGFKAVLARLAQTDDITVGTYIANRERTEIEGLIGFFLNTLVLRTEISRTARFTDALAAVRETALGAYDNQALPFEKLVEVIKPARDLGRNPLVQIVFQLQNATEDASSGASALIDYQRSAAAFDLAVTAYLQDGQLHFTYEYATDLFAKTTINRMSARLEQVLEQAIATPATRICDLDIILPDELPDFTVINPAENAAALSITHLFAKAKTQLPDAPAFFVGAACATIQQVGICADCIAHALRGAGVQKGDVVGVCLPRSVELSAALMGIWQIGGVYLPLDPAYPAARLGFMVQDSGARVVLVRHDTSDKVPKDVQHINVNAAIGDLSHPTPGFVPVQLSPDDPSHIIYTSGSTGTPKGALSPHRQVLNRMHWMWTALPHAPREVEVVKTATSFIDSIWELVGPMIARCPSTIVDADTLLTPRALVDQLARDGVTRMWTTPTYLRLLLDSVPDIHIQIPLLTTWFVTGEKLTAELARRFATAQPNARLLNLYGTSEAWDICCDLNGVPNDAIDPLPVGNPLRNVDVVILDLHGNPLPYGVPGEAYIGGTAPCLRFINRDDLTETRFRTLQTNTGPVRLLSSGDLARRRHDGVIDILGRVDDELKISGIRVHPAEVEAGLNAVAGISGAAVAGVAGTDGDLRLWAWIKTQSATSPDIAIIRIALTKLLPVHMLPDRITWVANFPVTPSGKVDRKALIHDTSRDIATGTQVDTVAKPASKLATEIAAVFSDMLKQPVTVHDNFFAAGGHSLLAARALARINDTLSLDLGIRDLFLDPTAAGLAARADAAGPTNRLANIKRLNRGQAGRKPANTQPVPESMT